MLRLDTICRLGKDAEIKQLQSGKTVISFSGACDVGYGDNKKTQWIDFSYFTDKTTIAQYLKKGTNVFVCGEPSIRAYAAKDGSHGASLQCIVREVKLLGGGQQAQQQQAANEQPRGNTHLAVTDMPEIDTDLPF